MNSGRNDILKSCDRTVLCNVMLEMKELLYFSVCRSSDFSRWVHKHSAMTDRRVLKKFSADFSAVFIPHRAISEPEIELMQHSIFLLRQKLSDCRKQVQAYFRHPDGFGPGQDGLKNRLDTLNRDLDIFFNERDQVLRDDKPLSRSHLEMLGVNKNEILKIINTMTDTIEACSDVNPGLIRLVRQLQQLLIELSGKQEEVERNMKVLQDWHDYQAALTQLVLENKTAKLGNFLSRQPALEKFLQENLGLLQPVQARFLLYLRAHPSLMFNPLEAESLMLDDRIEARKRQREILEASEREKISRLMNKRMAIFDAYRIGLESYERSDYGSALVRFIHGARDFHVPSLLMSGQMIMSGKGCRANPALACIYLQAAAACALSVEQKTAAMMLLSSACALSRSMQDERLADAGEQDKQAECFRDIFENLKKHIFQMQDKPAYRLFDLAESYLILYKSAVETNQDAQGKPNTSLVHACHYLEEAHRYAKRQLDQYYIVYVNVVEEEPDKDEGERAALVIKELEKKCASGGREKLELLLKRREELKIKYAQAKEVFNQIHDKISGMLNSILPSINEHRYDDNLLILKLSLNLKITLAASGPEQRKAL